MSAKRRILVAVLLVGAVAMVGLRTVRHSGRVRQIARGLYHQFDDIGQRRAFADEATAAYRADAPLVIYDDALPKGWKDWTWGKTPHTLKATDPVYDGSFAITVTPHDDAGFWLSHEAFGLAGYGAIQFYMYGDAALDLWAMNGKRDWHTSHHVDPADYARPVGASHPGWKVVKVPFSAFGIKSVNYCSGFVWRSRATGVQSQIALDDIELLPDESLPEQPTSATVGASINLDQDRHPISPYIYGMAFARPEYIRDLRLTINRWGGNDKSRYNWAEGNSVNAARDLDFRNRTATKVADPGPSGAADRFVEDNQSAGAQSLLTIPTIGWVAKNHDLKTKSLHVPWSASGKAINADGAVKGYDPTANRQLTSVPSFPRKPGPFSENPDPAGPVYQDEWVSHLVHKFGKGGAGGVRFYAMDNEPDLWDVTHVDIHPARTGYDDVLKEFLDYATAVKDVDPTAQVTGPVSFGWTGYLYSALDRGKDNFHTHADSNAHGGGPFLAWFLKQVHDHDLKTGKRSLDILDVHYYPQAAGVYSKNGDDPNTQALRLRSTRSLWDPTYIDQSWIHENMQVIPRLKGWIDQNYPGTKLAITEWDFGSGTTIDGGIADADALGIFGREDLYMATFWAFPAQDKPSYNAFKLFRNADGAGHGFGDVSVHAASADVDKLSVYAAVDSASGDTTVMLLNKMPDAQMTVPLKIAGLHGGARRVVGYRVSKDQPDEIVPLQLGEMSGSEYKVSLPPYSMTLLRISGNPRQAMGPAHARTGDKRS